jgi:hypothetical protein
MQDEITRLNAEIAEGRKHIASRKSLGTAFIECTLQLGAHVLAQCVSYHEPLKMVDKWIEVCVLVSSGTYIPLTRLLRFPSA